MSLQLEPTPAEREAMKQAIKAIQPLEGEALAQAFVDNAHRAAEVEIMRGVIVLRLMETLAAGDARAVKILNDGSVQAKAYMELVAGPTKGDA